MREGSLEEVVCPSCRKVKGAGGREEALQVDGIADINFGGLVAQVFTVVWVSQRILFIVQAKNKCGQSKLTESEGEK